MKRLACVVLLATIAACGIDARVLVDRDSASSGGPDGGSRSPDPFGDGGTTTPLPALDVFAGVDFTCALARGVPVCWGENEHGNLGTGDTTARSSATLVPGGYLFDTLALGENHTCGLEHGTGRVLCWGLGASGQLGQGDTTSHATPVVVSLSDAAVAIATGYNHSCAVLRSGALYCWGTNLEGELGQGVNGNRPTPVSVGTDSDWLAVSAGQGHTCALRRSGRLWCWGRNTDGQLGIGGPPAPGEDQHRIPMAVGTRADWRTIDLAQDSGCGITSDGALHCWGPNDNQNLGPGTGWFYVPTQVGSRTDWLQVSNEVFSTCAITRSSELFCAGRNVEGQLGLGDNDLRGELTQVDPATRWASVSVGRFHACATTADRKIRCTGENAHGELGLGNELRTNVFTDVSLPSGVDPGPVQ
jgi:alpha-tubulin suppressor-like RCC1 family protein